MRTWCRTCGDELFITPKLHSRWTCVECGARWRVEGDGVDAFGPGFKLTEIPPNGDYLQSDSKNAP